MLTSFHSILHKNTPDAREISQTPGVFSCTSLIFEYVLSLLKR